MPSPDWPSVMAQLQERAAAMLAVARAVNVVSRAGAGGCVDRFCSTGAAAPCGGPASSDRWPVSRLLHVCILPQSLTPCGEMTDTSCSSFSPTRQQHHHQWRGWCDRLLPTLQRAAAAVKRTSPTLKGHTSSAVQVTVRLRRRCAASWHAPAGMAWVR